MSKLIFAPPKVRDRVLAAVFDALVLFCVGVVLGLTVLFFPDSDVINDSVVLGVINVVAIIVGWLYYAIMESSRWQATLGKAWMGLLVTDLRGERVSFWRATLRYLAKWISILTLLVGFFAFVFWGRRQALHDILTGCLIVSRRTQTLTSR